MNNYAIRERLMPHDDEIMTEIPIDPFGEAAIGHQRYGPPIERSRASLDEIEKRVAKPFSALIGSRRDAPNEKRVARRFMGRIKNDDAFRIISWPFNPEFHGVEEACVIDA